MWPTSIARIIAIDYRVASATPFAAFAMRSATARREPRVSASRSYGGLVESGPRASASVVTQAFDGREQAGVAPLHTKADAPTSKDRCMTSGSFFAENTMTFASGFTCVIWRHASNPLTLGRLRSTTNTSGWSRCAASSSARPSETIPTTSQSSASTRQTAFATPGWSSAMSTRGRLGKHYLQRRAREPPSSLRENPSGQ